MATRLGENGMSLIRNFLDNESSQYASAIIPSVAELISFDFISRGEFSQILVSPERSPLDFLASLRKGRV